MLQIQNTIVSLDIIEKFFCCNLDECHGQCCVEGDAGAPIEKGEEKNIKKTWPKISRFMSADAVNKVKKEGVAYTDEEGDRVTTIIDGKDCAFTCYEKGICLCALEKGYRQGICEMAKPISCSLYPIRITDYPSFTAVNLHEWSVCKSAFTNGERIGMRVYEFLKEPLIRKFGKEWWDELDMTAQIYLQEKEGKNEP